MQAFYIKSMVSASIGALLFSGFAFGIFAGEHDPKAPQPKSEYSSDLSQKETNTPKSELQSSKKSEELTLNGNPIDEVRANVSLSASKMSFPKSNLSKEPLEKLNADASGLTLTSSETRVLRRLEKLNTLDSDSVHDNSEEETKIEYPEGLVAPLRQGDTVSSKIHKTETPLTSSKQDLYGEKFSNSSTPSAPAVAQSSLEEARIVVTPSAWDNGDERKDQKEEKADSPTSEGQGPEGKHKMGKFAPSGSIIPIIRMGENSQGAGGFTVIANPWNS